MSAPPPPPVPGIPREAPESDAARRAELAAYVRANEPRYTREALVQAARNAGYQPAEIEAAFGRVDAESPPETLTIPVAVGYVFLVIALGVVPPAEIRFQAVVAAVLGGSILAAALWSPRRAIARGLACGVIVVVTVPLVLLLALFGWCIVAGSRLY